VGSDSSPFVGGLVRIKLTWFNAHGVSIASVTRSCSGLVHLSSSASALCSSGAVTVNVARSVRDSSVRSARVRCLVVQPRPRCTSESLTCAVRSFGRCHLTLVEVQLPSSCSISCSRPDWVDQVRRLSIPMTIFGYALGL
jgi:hypothetical protein